MLTRLGYYADRVIEWGWLAAAVFAPLFFNVYSSRVFEPDKITTIRSFVLVMLVAWLVKLGERGWRSATQSDATTRSGKISAAATGVVETASPNWLGFLRVPVVIAILVYALVYLISSIFTVTPDASIFGSYQRLQGFYSQASYMMLGIIILCNMRTRAQVDRLVNFMLMTSLPVALYGLLQAVKLDPLPWAGDTSTRVASSMGNAIFVAAWLIMVVPFTLYRLFTGFTGAITAWNAADREEQIQAEIEAARGRVQRRVKQEEQPGYGWAVVANGVGVIISSMLVFFMALKMMAGLPYPDGRTWWILPLAIVYFYLSVWAIDWLGKRRDDPRQTGVFLPVTGVALFFVAFLALSLTWNVTNPANEIVLNLGFDGGGLLWAVFFFLLWSSIAALAYALAGRERGEAYANPDRGVVRASLNISYSLLFLVQLICIYLTQSRGPWLGLGAGLTAFMVAMWLVGRSRGVRWMSRLGGGVSAFVLALALFIGVLNIPNSPLQGLDKLPIVGRGVERLSTLTRTEDGTGKVRTLIWQGATDLVLSDPARALIGWGPESMYVAYNRFYPPELAQVELRNATPDRSHNVEFDHLVTMGVLGLLAYYFLVGTFFFFAVKLIKRATDTRDRLFAIALVSAIASHFIEIQTGIQIASTWTYFYLITGMMVAFGYYITTYLRPTEQAAIAVPVRASENGARVGDGAVDAALPEARPVTAPAAVGAASRSSVGAVTMQANSKSGAPTPRTPGQGQGGKSKASQPVQPTSGDGRKRQPQMRYNPALGAKPASQWYRSPVMLAVYGVALIVAIFIIWNVNSASVRADTLFKQAQAYDNASRYFTQVDKTTSPETKYPGSLEFYNEAISLQPNQDYYYLFLGRSWLEAAKQTDSEQISGTPANIRLNKRWSQDPQTATAEKQQEKIARLLIAEQTLKKANQLSPINTDHYANLGRLYLYWGDDAGGRDKSKAPLAVQWMTQATEHTPGNAQLWDELGVAYNRNGQFKEGVNALNHSQFDIDPRFARTPLIKGQLYEERAANIKNALLAGQALPTDGETDWGKLMLEAGRAYSDTIAIDPSQFVDTTATSKIDFLLETTQPFTKTNTQLPADVVSNVMTNTVQLSLRNQAAQWESQLADFLKSGGAYTGAAPVPDDVLQSLMSNPAWADVATQSWLDDTLLAITNNGALSQYGLALTYQETGADDQARIAYNRSLALKPTGDDVRKALQGQAQTWEGQMSSFLTVRGQTVPTDTTAPDATIERLLASPDWADQTTRTWKDPIMQSVTRKAAIYHYGMGLFFKQIGQTSQAQAEFGRAVLLWPTYQAAKQALDATK